MVEPESRVPYAISVCLARSSALSIGETIRSTVRKAARFAVYEEMMIKVKNHQTPPTIRPDRDLLEKRETIISLFIIQGLKQNINRAERSLHLENKGYNATSFFPKDDHLWIQIHLTLPV